MIAVAKITKSVGLKGQVQVESLSDQVGRLQNLKQVFVGKAESDVRPAVVETTESRGDRAVMKFRSVEDRTGADALRGLWIFVEDDQGIPAKKGSYFIHEIIGLKAFSEEGIELGVVLDVVSLPAGDTWVVKIGEREVMVPAVKEFIRDVDLHRQRVVIRIIEGLME
ncbi:MAG: ribosome maturation factor RimM [Bacteroidota bacterium]